MLPQAEASGALPEPAALDTKAQPQAFGTTSDPTAQPLFSFRLNRQKLREVRRREGRYLLRTNLCGRDPDELWLFYLQLTEVEAAFKNLKDDLQLRPIYINSSTVSRRTSLSPSWPIACTLPCERTLAPGLTSRAVLDKLAGIQMLDVHFPTNDGRTLILSRYTEPNPDQRLLVEASTLLSRHNPHPESPPPASSCTDPTEHL